MSARRTTARLSPLSSLAAWLFGLGQRRGALGRDAGAIGLEGGAAVARLLENPDLARSMGEAGRRHVLARYTWDHVAARMESMYEDLRDDTGRYRSAS